MHAHVLPGEWASHALAPALRTMEAPVITPGRMHACMLMGGLHAQVAFYAGYLVELAMLDYSMLKYCYSMIAAAAVLAANRALNRAPAFPHALLRHSGYTEAAVLPAAITLAGLHSKAAEASLKTVYKKYGHSSHGKARGGWSLPAALRTTRFPAQSAGMHVLWPAWIHHAECAGVTVWGAAACRDVAPASDGYETGPQTHPAWCVQVALMAAPVALLDPPLF